MDMYEIPDDSDDIEFASANKEMFEINLTIQETIVLPYPQKINTGQDIP